MNTKIGIRKWLSFSVPVLNTSSKGVPDEDVFISSIMGLYTPLHFYSNLDEI